MIKSDDKDECGLQSGGLIFLWDSDGQIPQNFRYLIISHLLFQLFVDSRESLLASPDLKSGVCPEEISGFNSVVEEPTDTNTH